MARVTAATSGTPSNGQVARTLTLRRPSRCGVHRWPSWNFCAQVSGWLAEVAPPKATSCRVTWRIAASARVGRGLQAEQVGVAAAAGEQFGVWSGFHESAFLQDEDQVGAGGELPGAGHVALEDLFLTG